MLMVFKKYSIPIDLQRYIMCFLQEREIYDKVISDLSKGIEKTRCIDVAIGANSDVLAMTLFDSSGSAWFGLIHFGN